jgi:outer membrane lipoprotein-sorting protein
MIRLCLTVLAAATLLPAADPLADVFAKMDQTAAKFKGMTAAIEQTNYTKMVDVTSSTSGTIALTRSKKGEIKFLVTFTSGVDAPSSSSYSGNEISTYNPRTNVEQQINVATKKQMIEQAMSLGFGAPSSEIKEAYTASYVGAEKIDGQSVWHIRLIPKSKEMLDRVKEAELWISDSLGLPLQQRLTPPSTGNYNQFKYSNIKVNPSISENDLQLKVRKGVQIQKVGN